jgi:predicted nucleic acid-binding protein
MTREECEEKLRKCQEDMAVFGTGAIDSVTIMEACRHGILRIVANDSAYDEYCRMLNERLAGGN